MDEEKTMGFNEELLGLQTRLAEGIPSVQTVSGGTMRLDGGTMFGVVPKTLWERKTSADEHNRIALDTRCLLVRVDNQTILVDSGYGDKHGPRWREHHGPRSGHLLLENLKTLGISSQEIDIVILTHLHFDHAGGCTRRDAKGNLEPTFPRARHVVQQAEWEDATGDLPELVGAYFKEDFLPLADAGLVELVHGDAEIARGVHVRYTGGHTRGHQIVQIDTCLGPGLFVADLCPTIAHIRTFWTMAYDQYLLDVRRAKPRVLGEAADLGWPVFFEHDPHIAVAYLARHEKKEFVLQSTPR